MNAIHIQQKRTKKWPKITYGRRRLPLIPAIPILFLVAVSLIAIFAPFIAPYPPTVGALPDKLMPPAWVEGGSSAHPIGTDFFGRDILSRLIYGARISLSVGLLAILFAGSLGTVVGLVSGYFGGIIDVFFMRVVDVGLSLPLILVAIVLAVALGPSFTNVIVVIVLLIWPRYARQIRGETLVIKEREFIDLGRVAGCSGARLMWRHIFPNVMPTLLVMVTLQVGWVILLEASLSFLGVGIPPPAPSWGGMVSDGRALIATAWWISVIPGLAILLTVLSMNLLGDWLRDRLDPKLKQI